MGTTAHVLVVGDQRLVEQAQRRIADLEQKWSRFVRTSDVARLNEITEPTTLAVSVDTIELIERSRDAMELSGGAFNPIVAHLMDDNGYTPVVEGHQETDGRERMAPLNIASLGQLACDRGARTVTVDGGLGFDPGGIGKGLAADIVCAELIDDGAAGALVNIGGDVGVVGDSGASSWMIDIEDPRGGPPRWRVHLEHGGVATSSTLKRRWDRTSGTTHHLIDMGTHQPSAGPVIAATVIAASGWQAEALTKVAFSGPVDADDSCELIERHQVACLTSTWDVDMQSARWTEFADALSPDLVGAS